VSDEPETRITMRECPNAKCKCLNSLVASVCGRCGSTMAMHGSGSYDLFACMVLEARITLLALSTPNDEAARLIHEANELETWYRNAAERDGAERNEVERRAVLLATAVMAYRRPA